MPFIFHAKKQSIFQAKVQEPNQKFINSKYAENKDNEYSYTTVSLNVCREYPFRVFHKPELQQKITKQEKYKVIEDNQALKQKFKSQRQKICKSTKRKRLPRQNRPQNYQLQIKVNNEAQKDTKNTEPIKKRNISPKLIIQETSCFKKPMHASQQRLKYSTTQQTPGPGSYNNLLKNNSTSQLIYPTLTKTFPLRHNNNSNELLEYTKSLQNKVSKKLQQKRFNLECSYKNQSSPCFKTSVLSNGKKNSFLLSVLFSQKSDKGNKDNQSQTTCQSRINLSNYKSKYFEEDEYIKVEQRSPSPCSYDPNLKITIKQSTKGKSKDNKIFITGEERFLQKGKMQASPGPGYYQYQNQSQKGQLFGQNQNKRPNKFAQDQQNKPLLGFSSTIPRELDFGMGQKCQQQLYYSPKNNMTDILKQKQNKSTLSNQYYFGSSLQRYPKDDKIKEDPYKYCFAKIKYIEQQRNKSGVFLSSKEKRQIFKDLKQLSNNPSPLAYHDKVNTLQKSTQNALQKIDLKCRYNQQIVQLKQKKEHMRRVLYEQKINSMDLKSTAQTVQEINPDSYKEYLLSKKRAEKKNISFGYNKDSLIDRAFKPKEELDGYYETQPGWDVKSFNKQYGYETYE